MDDHGVIVIGAGTAGEHCAFSEVYPHGLQALAACNERAPNETDQERERRNQ